MLAEQAVPHLQRLSQQRQRFSDLQEQMRQTIDEAAETEPLLSERLYETARDATHHSLHIHGGYGFGMEGDIQLYYRRSRGWAMVYGEPSVALDRVADARYGAVAG